MDLDDYDAGWYAVLNATGNWDVTTKLDAWLCALEILEPVAESGDPFAQGVVDACRSLSAAAP